jgi:hypothetical protein
MNGLQVLDRTSATQVERVLADAAITRVRHLALRDVSELVFNDRAFAQRRAAGGGVQPFAETCLQPLVLSNLTVRPRPGAAVVQSGRTGQTSHTVGSIRRPCRRPSVAPAPAAMQSCGRED